jgi:hypothetical protein
MGKGANRGRLLQGGLCPGSETPLRNLFARTTRWQDRRIGLRWGRPETQKHCATRLQPLGSTALCYRLLFQISWGECRI